MRITKALGIVCGLFLLVAACHADCRKAQRVQQVQAVQLQAAVVAQFAPLVVQVPTFSISYNAEQADDGDVLAELRAIRGLLDRITGGQVTIHPLSGLPLAQAKCASCHGQAQAGTKGGGFTMFDKAGAVLPLSLPEKRRAVDLVERGVMPRGSVLSEAERKAFREWLLK